MKSHHQSRAGQILVETCAALPLQCLVAMVTLGAGLWAFAQALSGAEAYSLARSSLYGNVLRECGPSSQWPTFRHLRVIHTCTGPGRVHTRLTLPSITERRNEMNRDVVLVPAR